MKSDSTIDPMELDAKQPQNVKTSSLIDSSALPTVIAAIFLILYGSIRSMNISNEQTEKAKNSRNDDGSSDSSDEETESATTETINISVALCMPIAASVSLVLMFLFFDSMQLFFTLYTAAFMAFSFLLHSPCKYLMRQGGCNIRVTLGCCGRFSVAELLSMLLSFILVVTWLLTGHWLLMDALAMGLCVAFITLVQLPSLKVSTLLLLGLLVYDVFWVFFSSYIFSTNVMVNVATRTAQNPIRIMAKKLHLSSSIADNSPKLSLPGKLVFPSPITADSFSILGLGDIVIPGLLLCFVLRFDAYKRTSQVLDTASPQSFFRRFTYTQCALVGYLLGLLTSAVTSELFASAQPALLYLVPFTLLPLVLMAYVKGDLVPMWNEPFKMKATPQKVVYV